jgi:hypothetical protein
MSAAKTVKRRVSESRKDKAQLLAIYRKFKRQPAQMTEEQMKQIEAVMQSYDINRRLLLGSLKNPARVIIKMAKNDELAPSVAQLVVAAESYARRLRDLADLMDTAHTRLSMALCERTDMSKLLKTARAEVDARVN